MNPQFLPVAPLEQLRQRRSAKWQGHPPDVLPLPVAEMDFGIAAPVRAVLREAVERADLGYAFPGRPLGQAVAGFTRRAWDWAIDPDDVRAIPDVNSGLLALARVLVRPGDQVVVSPPCYPPFFDWLEHSGGRPVTVPLARRPDGGYRLDLDALDTAFRAGAGVYLLCNPHNPTGAVATREELTALAELAARHGVRVLSDEIHAPMVFPGQPFVPFLTVPGGADVGFSLLSASKTWNLAGLKCAVVVAGSDNARAGLTELPMELSWSVGHLGVLASEAAFTHGDEWVGRLVITLADRRDRLAEMVAERLPGVVLTPSDGTYFAWLDCRSVGAGEVPFHRFYDEARVALQSGPNFGAPGDGYVRLNFATSLEILDEATARMARVVTGSR